MPLLCGVHPCSPVAQAVPVAVLLLLRLPLRRYPHQGAPTILWHLLPHSYSHPLQLELEGGANPGGDTRTFPDRCLFLLVFSTQTQDHNRVAPMN